MNIQTAYHTKKRKTVFGLKSYIYGLKCNLQVIDGFYCKNFY